MFKNSRIIFLAFVMGIFLSLSAMAMAESVASDTTNLGTVGGYSYGANGLIFNDSGARGYSVITRSGGTVPTGYMGISIYVYNSAGACVTYSPWSYNTSSIQSIGSFTSWYTGSHDYYRSKGSCKMYNGSNYTEKPSNYTPYLYY
ncbi:hypothetical protein E4K67_27590 [Desulfosporosinus fructosivorans]|uniref:Uncharacterized protein n=1 Tax=Desulfosporosinus fructosivorans TaxID=2018669 RepID=A0A4Z0QZ19_9FIRM|nr:hypothetical protein [Desulfosporosinus fructosivorans]TGE34997.1 hypothetical protein E4K67_27590 [Desulfosporosinus fructosivorans]